MHVVFEQMVESIRERGDSAGDSLRDAVVEGEREEGLVTGGEGNVLEFAVGISDLCMYLAG